MLTSAKLMKLTRGVMSSAAWMPSASWPVASEGAGDYELVLTPPARRGPTGKLPEAVAAAVSDPSGP